MKDKMRMVSVKASQNSWWNDMLNSRIILEWWTSFRALIDPLADSAWRVEYEKETKEDEALEKELYKRQVDGPPVGVDTW